jgi:hypothetical protein
MHKLSLLFALLIVVPSCKKKEEGGGDSSGKTAEGGKAADGPKLEAEPEPAAITPAEKPPFESFKFRRLAKRNQKGWPKYDAYNLGTKPIKYLAIWAYVYDASGNQVGRTKVPLSWNGNIDPGQKSSFDIDVGGMDDLPAGAASFEICVSAVKLDGDADQTSDHTRCPEKKAKG